MATTTLPFTLIVFAPPAGVVFAVQLGRTELLPPSLRSTQMLTFVFPLTYTVKDGRLVLSGPAAQGPPAGRFVYVNSGRRAGDAGSPWERRAKVSLGGISVDLIDRWHKQGVGRAVIGGEIAGTARDGGPVCATVPLLDKGSWRVIAF